MIVKTDLPPRDVWRLEAAAERAGMDLSALIAQAVLHFYKPSSPTRQQVGELVAAGWCDADIAARLHLVNGTVKDHRRALGLKANKRNGNWSR